MHTLFCDIKYLVSIIFIDGIHLIVSGVRISRCVHHSDVLIKFLIFVVERKLIKLLEFFDVVNLKICFFGVRNDFVQHVWIGGVEHGFLYIYLQAEPIKLSQIKRKYLST
jgi:hypothetical protein